MLRRLLPTIAALGAGLGALLWGLLALEGIVIVERRDGHERIAAERRALEAYARKTIEQTLEGRLHDAEAEIEAAAADPLLPTEHLLWWQGPQRILPRETTALPGDQTPARALYEALRGDSLHPLPTIPSDDPTYEQRLQRFSEVRAALADDDPAAVEGTVRALLRHRARFVIDSRVDIPVTLALLDLLSARSTPSRSLMRGLLLDGTGDTPASAGLQRLLLMRRDRFTAGDFEFLAQRIIELSDAASIEVDEFRKRTTVPASALAELADPPAGPSIIASGRYYVAPVAPGKALGVAIDVPGLVGTVAQQMHDRGLLEMGERLQWPEADAGLVHNLELTIVSPRFAAARADVDNGFWIKSAFVVGCGALAVVLAALALLLQARQRRFVELKSEFVAAVSHELRTPLASIRLMAETVARRTRGLDSVRDYPDRIVSEIDELAFLVENLLSWGRIDRGKLVPHRAEFEVAALLREVADDAPRLCSKEVVVEVEAAPDLTLTADRDLLKVVLHNLIKNAGAYHERPKLHLTLSAKAETDGRITIDVADDGVGIPAAQHEEIFTDFYRVGRPSPRGSGLGLAICRKTMEAHGGSIEVAQSSSEGTTFRLTFAPNPDHV